MEKVITYDGIKEFLYNIINAPIVEDPDYLIGTYDDKLIRMNFDDGGAVTDDAKAGDICFYDSQKDKKVIVDYDTWNEDPSKYPASRYTPIGVVAIPVSHNVYNTGECAVISLKNMSCSSPDEGTCTDTEVIFGNNTEFVSGNMGVYCICVNTTTDPTIDKTSTSNFWAYMPSDYFNGTQCPTDPEAFYSETVSGNAAPSPYLEDGSRNSVYYYNNGQKLFCLADFDGVGNTQLILDHVTVSDWQTSSTINDSFSSGNYPAACCCWRYHTDGTNQGDWYLPACGELGYVVARAKKINETIEALIDEYGDTIGISFYDDYLFTSTQYNSYLYERVTQLTNGYIYYAVKTSSRLIRAFLRV